MKTESWTRSIAMALLALAMNAACTQQPAAQSAAPAQTEPQAPAQSIFETHLTPGACFARSYDQAHLARHPRQTVTTFILTDPGDDFRRLNTPTQRHVAFAFQIENDPDIYTGIGICAPRPGGATCDIEGDGGAFTIQANGPGLRIGIARMEVEGPERFAPDLAEGDNRIILLEPGAATDCMVD